MSDAKPQHIKLRCVGSPVIWDAIIVESTPDAKRIKVRFNGPLEDAELFAVSDSMMASDMIGTDGTPTTEYRNAVKHRLWEVR